MSQGRNKEKMNNKIIKLPIVFRVPYDKQEIINNESRANKGNNMNNKIIIKLAIANN